MDTSPAPGRGTLHGMPEYARKSRAKIAVTLSGIGLLSVIGIFFFPGFGLLAIVGLFMGRAELRAIDRGEVDPADRGIANAAYIVGLIGLVVWAVAIVVYSLTN